MIGFLLPADHAVGVVLEDQHHDMDAETNRRLHLLRIHHEAAVAAHGENFPLGMNQRGGDRRRKPRPHGRQRIVEQQRVGDAGAVIAREPDLVHAVVERHDAVRRHRFADVMDDALRRQRKTIFGGTLGQFRQDFLAQAQQRAGIGQACLRGGPRAPQGWRRRRRRSRPPENRPVRRSPAWRRYGPRAVPSALMMKGGFSTVSWPMEMMRSALSTASWIQSRSDSAAVPI